MIMPVAAAFAVAAITFLLAEEGRAEADLRAMIAPLVTFLPGAALTMAVVELSAGEMITGASRLVAGTLQLLLLGFGIVDAAQVVGLPSADALVDTPTDQLGWWAPWVGVLLVGIGNYLYFSAPGGSLGRLLLVLYAAWIGQYLGDQALGGYLSGFVGASVMTPVAYIPERRPSGPPALVSFLPAFWLLVPGALVGHSSALEHDPMLLVVGVVAVGLALAGPASGAWSSGRWSPGPPRPVAVRCCASTRPPPPGTSVEVAADLRWSRGCGWPPPGSGGRRPSSPDRSG
jgi:uncharacterized membrane protein YjjB (DUF3815 family)